MQYGSPCKRKESTRACSTSFAFRFLQPIDKSRLIADAAGVSGSFFFEADSRVLAFVAVHDWYTQLGREVTVLSASLGQKANPLGFSSQELLQIKDRGVEVRLGFNESEVQIESIEEISYNLSS
jgi:hypothetical protein